VKDEQGKRGQSQAESATLKGLGEYCKGKDVDECLKYFGEMLETVCSTCPN